MSERVFTAALGREVALRPEGSDRQVWADTFTGLYHLPPPEMPTPATVLDLGANIGLTAAHYRALWPAAEIVAVEMDETCARLAAENAPGVRICNEAVSALGGPGSYDPAVRAEGYAFTPGDPADSGRAAVDSLTLREIILREFGEGGVDFVKMDVEGTEWEILALPTWAPLVRYLLIELHDLSASSAELLERARLLLVAAGFRARHQPPHPQAIWAQR